MTPDSIWGGKLGLYLTRYLSFSIGKTQGFVDLLGLGLFLLAVGRF